MQKVLALWLHGLFAALIGGAAGGVCSAFTAMGLAPDKFNLGLGLTKTLEMALASAVLQGVLSAAFYLKQSPLPPEIDDDKEPVK